VKRRKPEQKSAASRLRLDVFAGAVSCKVKEGSGTTQKSGQRRSPATQEGGMRRWSEFQITGLGLAVPAQKSHDKEKADHPYNNNVKHQCPNP
jgi:phospholipase/lecithinase/hemolysin